MGMYVIPCPGCGKGHYWFSGNLDQRCPFCRGVRAMTEAECAAMDRALERSQVVIDPGSEPSEP
jgi:hypothetical protein